MGLLHFLCCLVNGRCGGERDKAAPVERAQTPAAAPREADPNEGTQVRRPPPASNVESEELPTPS
jgi:hypothetical protein